MKEDASKLTLKEFTLSREEYFGVLKKIYMSNIRFLIVVPLAILAIAAYIYLTKTQQVKIEIYLMIFLILLCVDPIISFMQMRKKSTNSENKNLFAQKKISVDNKFIYTFTKNIGEGKIQWSSMTKMKELKDHFLLFYSKSQYIIIPKKIITSKKDNDYFFELLTQQGLT